MTRPRARAWRGRVWGLASTSATMSSWQVSTQKQWWRHTGLRSRQLGQGQGLVAVRVLVMVVVLTLVVPLVLVARVVLARRGVLVMLVLVVIALVMVAPLRMQWAMVPARLAVLVAVMLVLMVLMVLGVLVVLVGVTRPLASSRFRRATQRQTMTTTTNQRKCTW